MKKFLEEFNKANDIAKQDVYCEALVNQREFYKKFVGKKAIYYTRNSEPRIVIVLASYPTFLLMEYKTYSTSGASTKMKVCSHYGSLYCGDDRLCLE